MRSIPVEQPGLVAFLEREVWPGASHLRIEELVRPTGGASWETFLLRVAFERDGALREERAVIKRAPATGPLAPYRVDKDVAIFGALAKSEVPAPPLLAWTEDPEVFERPFTLTAFVEGATHDLTKVEQWEVWQRDRESLGIEMLDTLAALHRFRWQEHGLGRVMDASGPAAAHAGTFMHRYFDLLARAAEEQGAGIPVWRDMAAWIEKNAPVVPQDELVLVHGDYRFGNFIWQDTRIVAVVDWERAMLGPPMQDLAFMCLPLSRRKEPEVMAKAISFDRLASHWEVASGCAVDFRMLQYYAVLWQFVEGVNGARALLAGRRDQASTGILALSNLVIRQTLKLMDDHDAGRDIL